ncbi:MAG: aspartyl protease family protein [Desulfobacteraceae bacterium]|jgi:clan AA aspartic protease (TIGR02281 family)|nr:aspartyl protease family protein [Desulfobacteraceae bacterium]
MDENDFEIITPEDEIPVVCPKCQTSNPEGSNFCLNCGLSMLPSRPNRANWVWLTVCILIFAGMLVFFYQRLSKYESKKNIPQIAQVAVPAPRKKSSVAVKDKTPVKKEREVQQVSAKMKIPVGLVVIKDISGKVINELPVPVVGNGWVALPKAFCLGGAEWIIKMGPNTEVAIVAGLYSDYDRVGLWRIPDDLTVEGPPLYPWSAEEPTTWLSIQAAGSAEPVQVNNPREQGYFMVAEVSTDFDEIGVLIQNDRVVGWTFGDVTAGAFVWNGDEGSYLRPAIRVDDFYRITFANSREEEFTKALAMGEDYRELERLEAFANGFRFESKLAPSEIPADLQKENVIKRMQALIDAAVKAGSARQVASLFDTQILLEAGDVDLLIEVARATAQSYGFEDGIGLAENVAGQLAPIKEQDSVRLTTFFSELYQNWIVTLFNKGSLQAAWRAYRLGSRKLPDDLGIHLLGVQLALAENNWAEAEELLAEKEYPASLRDKVDNLQNQIAGLKGQEGKIVINFAPGSRFIPVSAVLNRDTDQNFIVDTGASMVTIPRSTAEYLDLAVDDRNPMRKVVTAGGVRYAPEVTLYSITIGGWEINDVKALVLDIPDQPELGLLGLNYLQNFRMDMNTEAGVLLLEPR